MSVLLYQSSSSFHVAKSLQKFVKIVVSRIEGKAKARQRQGLTERSAQ